MYNVSTCKCIFVIWICFTGLRDVLGLAVNGDHVYWTDRGNIDQSFARANKMSGQYLEPLIRNVGGYHGLIAVNQSTVPGKRNNMQCHCY